MSGNTFAGMVRSTITVRQDPKKYCQHHHASIQENQFVFIKKTDATEELGYDTYAASLADVNVYIKKTLADLVTAGDCLPLGTTDAFFSNQDLLAEHVGCWIPWGPCMTQVVKQPNQGFNRMHTSGPSRRDLVIGYIGKGMLSAWDIHEATTAHTGSQLFIELHWAPVPVSNLGVFTTLYVPEFRIVAYPATQKIVSKAYLGSEHIFPVLRWNCGVVFHNTNTERRPLRQLTAQLPNMALQSRTLVEVNFNVSRFSFFTSVPLPFSVL